MFPDGWTNADKLEVFRTIPLFGAFALLVMILALVSWDDVRALRKRCGSIRLLKYWNSVRLHKPSRLAGYCALAALAVMFMAAGVNGVFNSVTSSQGYQVNGAAGSAGQGLCSDGTRFNTPCSLASGTITAVTVTSPITGGGSSGSVNVACPTCALTTAFTPRTCNVNGCYEVINGTVHEWGVTSQFDTGPSTITLPLTMPAALENVVLSQCFDTSGGCNGTTTTRQWEAGNFSASSFDARNDGTGAAFWNAWGH